MASVTFKVSVVERPQQIGAQVRKAIAIELNKVFQSAQQPIERGVKKLLRRTLEGSPTIQSITGGKLKVHLGIPDPERKLDAVLDAWVSSVKVIFRPVRPSGGRLVGGLTIEAVKKDWADVLSLPEAQQSTEKGQRLAWLDWLLNQGDRTIIKEFDIVAGRGRAGNMIMRARPKGKWRVPPEYAGTTNNNFVTKALAQIEEPLEKLVLREIKRQV